MLKKGLIKRSEIANMLKTYQRDEWSRTKLSSADLEFIKTLLLPVKAKLIEGLQNYKTKRHIEFDEYQFEYANKCIQSIRDQDLYWALKYFISIYKFDSPFQTYCSYCELVISILLAGSLIDLCDKMLAEIAESGKMDRICSKTDIVRESVSDPHRLNNLEPELNYWHQFYSDVSLKKYFKLTDKENNFIEKSVTEAFRAIVACRKNNVSMESFIEGIQAKMSCFFSALGAPNQISIQTKNKRKRGKMF